MDETDKARLADLDEHIAKGQRCIAEQKRLIERLVAVGGDVKGAWERLVAFEDTLNQMLLHRCHLLAEIKVKRSSLPKT